MPGITQTIAVDIGRESLDPDQLATEFFETVIVETKAELNPAIGDAALGDEAPEDLLQHPLKVHASALFATTCRRYRMSCSRPAAIAPQPL